MRKFPTDWILLRGARVARARGRRSHRHGRSCVPAARTNLSFECFELRLMLDGTPVMAEIDSLGFGADNGQINPTPAGQPADVDVYQYSAPVTQTLDVRVQAMGTLQSATLSIFAPTGQQLLSAPGQIDQPVTEVRFGVVAGTTYYVDVAAGAASFSSGLSGPYQLVFTDFSDQYSSAYPLIVPSGASAVAQAGAIDPVGVVDWFEVTAPLTGSLTADLAAAPAGALEGQLLVENSTGVQSASDDSAAAGAADSGITGFQVQAGQTYHIEVAAADSVAAEHQTGTYVLNISFAPFTAGHSLATASPLIISSSGSAAQNGIITTAGVSDYYRYVASQSTNLVIREESPPGSGLDSLLTVDNAAGEALPGGTSYDDAWADQAGNFEVGGEVRVPVVANQSYYIKAGGFGSSTGAYDLTVTPDSIGATLATAVPLTLSRAGALTAPGTILFPGDVEFYQFVAPISGAMTIQQDAVGFGLDSFLTIFDASQRLVTFDDDSDQSVTGYYKNSLVQFAVTAGQTYYALAAAYPNLDGSGATGSFTLKFATDPNPPADNQPDSFAKAEPVNVSSGFARLSGSIDSDTDVNVFQFVAPIDESIEVDLDPAGATNFQGFLYAFDAAGNQVATDYNLSLLQGDTTSTVALQRRRRSDLLRPGCVVHRPDRSVRPPLRGRSADPARCHGCQPNIRHRHRSGPRHRGHGDR